MMLALTQVQQSGDSGGFIALFFFLALLLLFVVIPIAATWQIFVKAGQPGWAALVPVYNLVILLKIVQRPIWWLVLLFVPFVNFVVPLILMYDLARVFGKGVGFTVGLILLGPIFLALLAFGEAQYLGEGGAVTATPEVSLALAGVGAGSSSSTGSTSVPLSYNDPPKAMDLGSPLELAGVALSLLLIVVFLGIIGVQVSGRNSRAEAPTAPVGQVVASAPAPAGALPAQGSPPATGVEEPVFRGTLAVGEQISDTLDGLFVAHDWNFVGAAGQRVTISCDPTSGATTDPVIELISSDGRVLGKDDDGGGDKRALLSTITLPHDGTYTVRVTVWSSGAYSLRVE
jgi:hypothetical protein